MGKFPVLKPSEVIRALEKIGFVIVRQKGSHIQLRHVDGRGTTVPTHKGRDISPILLKQILKDVKIEFEEFKNNL